MRKNTKCNSSPSVRRCSKASLEFENLEPRTVLASITLLPSGVVQVLGDPGNDNIQITPNAAFNGFDIDVNNGAVTDSYLYNDVVRVQVLSGNGDDLINNTSHEKSQFNGQNGNDTIFGGYGNDYLVGGSGDDTIYTRAGFDRALGQDGNDKIYGGQGNNKMWGGNGNDQLYGGNDVDNIFGENGNDVIVGGNGNDSANGGEGDDFIAGGEGDDFLGGIGGNDTINGGNGNDTIFGNAGDDILSGGGGNDTIDGGADNDIIRGNDGVDTIQGNNGDDSVFGGLDGDIDDVRGGAGFDRIFIENEAGIQDTFDGAAFILGDAILALENDDQAWTDAEVEAVDAGLEVLYQRVDSNVLASNLLNDENGNLDPVTYLINEDVGDAIATNTPPTNAATNRREIRFSDAAFNLTGIIAERVVVHEFGHSWHDANFFGVTAVNDFLAESNWTTTDQTGNPLFLAASGNPGPGQDWWYLADTEFAPIRGDAGRVNPFEDWSTMWEQFFFVSETGTGDLGDKLDVITTFMNAAQNAV